MGLSRWDPPEPPDPALNTHTDSIHICTFAWMSANNPSFNSKTKMVNLMDTVVQTDNTQKFHLLWPPTWNTILNLNDGPYINPKNIAAIAPQPVFTNWLQALVIVTAKTPINPPLVSSSLLSDPGPLDSAQRPGCSSVMQKRRTERGPYWLLFRPTEWHYWNPSPGCVHVWRQ